MRVALDTNAYSDFVRGAAKAVEVVGEADALLVPFVVLAELRSGFAHGGRGRRNEAALVRFLGSPRASVVYADEQTTHHYAHLYAYLRGKGTPVPTNDLWIAALCMQHDAPLLTRDAHFAKFPQLALA